MSDTITTPASLLALIYDDLSAWVEANGGSFHLTKNPFDLVNLLNEEPGGWRLTMHWEGDEPADERTRECAVLRNRIRFILDGQIGLTVIPAIGLIKTTAARSPFLAVLDAVKQRVMAYRFPWLTYPNNALRYKGADDKLQIPDGLYLAAYNLSFELYSVQAIPTTDINLPPVEED